MNRWLAFAPLVVLVLLAVLFVGWSLKRDPEIRPDALVGKPLPPAPVRPLSGGEVTALDGVVQGPALVNVFASWCAPCRVEHPQLTALQAQGVTIVGVAYKDAPQDAAAFLAELGDPFASTWSDLDGRAGIELGISGVPETFLVDARGVVVAKHAGPLMASDAEIMLQRYRELDGGAPR